MNRRWVCPNECGNNVHAPGRMRRDDVRRYCLPCSERSGRLVERVAPALERKRAEAVAARRERERKAAAAERARRWCLADGTDVRTICRRVRALEAWKREGPRVVRAVKAREYYVFDPSDNAAHVAATHIWGCASTAGRVLGAVPFGGLALAALSEYFDIPEKEIMAVQRTTTRLEKREVHVTEAAAICARARGL